MCNPIVKSKLNHGYSVIELAIVLVMISIVLTPALYAYSLYKRQQQVENTQSSLLETLNALGDFKGIYGRYPCPARADAVIGDADFGYESRDLATGLCVDVVNGVWKATSNNAALANTDVFIGSIPFRQMNLSDEFVYDGYRNRLSYAVTGLLTNDLTYSNGNGGITIIDKDNNIITDQPHTAHFALLSHNANSAGAVTREGSLYEPCPAAAPETENCNRDAIFRADEIQSDFDDLVYYNTSDSIEQWQFSNPDPQDIHLRRSDSIAIGIDEQTSTTGFAEIEVKDVLAGDGILLIGEDILNASSGSFQSSDICDENGTNCFPSNRIAGQISDSEGMDCSPEFLVGIRNGQPVCSAEVFFSCPAGTFVSGFNASGKVVCNVTPAPSCPTATLMSSCGSSRSVSSFIDTGVWYGYAYSGQCHRIAALDSAVISGLSSIADVKAYVDTLNNSPRTTVDCGPTSSSAMVRDTFECEPNGVWNATPVRKLERINTYTNLSSYPPLYNGGYYPADIGPLTFNPSTPMSADPNNTISNHDCWCREDYRVNTASCTGGAVGTKFTISRHACPQTCHGTWTKVYPASGENTQFCGCSESDFTNNISCKSHFGYSGIGITGTVVRDWETTCPGGPSGSPVTAEILPRDTSNCACPNLPPVISTAPCPTGTTNSFTYGGQNYTGVNEVYSKDWSCPGGPAPVQPISSAADAGSYGTPALVHTEACVCNTTLTQPYHEACPAGLQGSGRDWVLPWNCVTGTYDAPSASNQVNDDCRACVWQPGSARAGLSSTAAPVEVNTACPSCSGVNSCFDARGAGLFKIWDGCYCAGQP